MRYRPLNQKTKQEKFVGKYWTNNLVRMFKVWGEIYGYNTGDKKFETWVNSDKNKTKMKLTEEDWDKWYYKK